MTDELAPLPAPSVDRLALVFRLVAAANEYGFSINAAANAAIEVLADASAVDAVTVAALLAALVVTDLRPRDGETLEAWATRYAAELIGRES
jgi:hypothetical protein